MVIDVKAIIAQEKIRSELLTQINAILGSNVTQSDFIFPLNTHCKENEVPIDYCNGGYTGTISEQEFALLCLGTNLLS